MGKSASGTMRRDLLCFVFALSGGAFLSCGGSSVPGIQDGDFLGVSGRQVRKDRGRGDEVFLRGVNAGGYMLQEFWMCLTEYTGNVTCQSELIATLERRFGKEAVTELEDFYQQKYWTEADFDNCAGLGMNCIRLPIWHRNIVDADGTLRGDAWERLDWFIQEAGKRGIYVIIDMHGAPGSQNGSDHSGVDGRNDKKNASRFFWGDDAERNQELFYFVWEQIAARYKGNPVVAGYDLLNEPYCTYRYSTSHTDGYLHDLLWGIYDEAYKRIRAVDGDHIIIMEATWDAWDLPSPDKYGWENVMYEYHNYLYDDYDNAQGRQLASMRSKLDGIKAISHDVPDFMGEFNYMNNPSAWDEGLALLNEAGMHWTVWTYKTTAGNGNWGLFHHTGTGKVNIETDSLDTIKRKWANAVTASENTRITEVLRRHLPGTNKTKG